MSRPVHVRTPSATISAGQGTTSPDQVGRASGDSSERSETASDQRVTTAALQPARLDDQEITGWRRYRVLLDDQLVGVVAEWHDWIGHRYGPRRWEATHNPTGEAFRACWRSQPCRTRQGALAALAEHLEHHR